MTRFTVRILVGFLLLGLSQGCAASQPEGGRNTTAKPGIPLTLSIETDEEPRPGAILEITVTAETRIASPSFLLEVDLPDSLALFSGDQRWQGPVQPGAKQTLRFAIRVPDQGSHTITARAAVLSRGQVLSLRREYTVGPDQQQATRPPNRRQGTRDGQGVIEYELR